MLLTALVCLQLYSHQLRLHQFPGNTLHSAQALSRSPVHEAVMDKHVGNAEQCDAQASAKAQAASHGGCEEAIQDERNGWHCVHDGKQVVGLQDKNGGKRKRSAQGG